MLNNKEFDLWADGYDKCVQLSEDNNEYPFAGYKNVLNTIYKQVRQKNGKVLDIGFGTGILTEKLYNDGYQITGIDFSNRMIEIAQDKMPKANLIQFDFTKGLPKKLDNTNYDWIISTYAIHHLTDIQKKQFIEKLINHLILDGSIIFGDVVFQTLEDLEQAKYRNKKHWDEEEYYIIVDELQKVLPTLNVNFKKITHCSGIVTIQR